MGIIVPEGYNNATFVFTCAGLTDEMVFSIGYVDSVVDPGTPNELAETIRNNWTGTGAPFIAANMTAEYTFQGVRIVRTVDGEPVLGESMIPVVGTQSLDSIPANTATLVRKNTAAGGRRNRGRMFIPSVATQGSDVLPSGFWAIGEQSTKQAQINVAVGADGTDLLSHVLFHSDGGTPTAITSFAVANQVATQRRRMR